MKNTLLPLLCLFLLIPGISAGAELRTLEIEFTFAAPEYPDKQLAGYTLYKEGEQVCQTADSTATMITCDILTEDGTFNFTLTGYYSDNSESAPSPSFPFTIDSTSTVPLHAVISPASSSGEVPLNISFTGTDSTGDISSYYWEFGDSTTATGSLTSHTYSIPGTYSATLRVEDESGAASTATTTITVLPTATPPEPPTAVLASSTAAGNAPLAVDFDGTPSTTPNPPIVSYNWTFGDGSQIATGKTVSHAYSAAGTYHAELTVTDSLGLTGKIDTPIIVLGTVVPNEKPEAKISTDLTEGDAPLVVFFDGSQSSDADGSIARYDWNFGDGTTGSGPTIQHTYTDAAIYTMSLQVTDDRGETDTVTREIVSSIAPTENILNFEVGEISIDHEWVTVEIENDFNQPVVVAGPPTFNGTHSVLIRVRNVNQESFEIRLQEWDYLDGSHSEETLTYLVMEKGIHTLDSGIKIEAGSFTGSARFQDFSLQQAYDSSPVILTQVMTEDDPRAVTGRIKNSSQSSFEYKLQEQETTKNGHSTETIGYIAWEPGKGEIQGLLFEAGLTSESVTHNWFDLTFETVYPDPDPPLFVANMQTYEGRDTAAVRTRNMSQTGTEIKVEEEQSKDSETSHVAEVVGYLVIGSAAAE